MTITAPTLDSIDHLAARETGTADELLAEMLAAWREDIDSVPFRPADQPVTHCPLCKQLWARCTCGGR
jgi:hypothetical protein